MSESELVSRQQLDSAQLQVYEAVIDKSPQRFASGMDQFALLCEEAAQMPAKKKQCVAFDLSQNSEKSFQAKAKHMETLTQIQKMKRALEAMEGVAEVEANLLDKAAQVKRMEKHLEKEVHFSQRVRSGAALALHVLEDGSFHRLTEDVQLDRILQSSVLWIAPEGTTYCKNDIEVCKKVSIKLDSPDATYPGRLGFRKQGYKHMFLNSPRYQLCDGKSVNLCALLGDTWQLVITPRDPHKNRGSFVNSFNDIWIGKNL